MQVLHIAKSASEWHRAVLDRDGYRCNSQTHAEGCNGRLVAHHLVYRAHLSPRSLWIVENGICLADACHLLAHETHNVSVGLMRANEAVAAVNCIESIKIPKFTKKGIAA